MRAGSTSKRNTRYAAGGISGRVTTAMTAAATIVHTTARHVRRSHAPMVTSADGIHLQPRSPTPAPRRQPGAERRERNKTDRARQDERVDLPEDGVHVGRPGGQGDEVHRDLGSRVGNDSPAARDTTPQPNGDQQRRIRGDGEQQQRAAERQPSAASMNGQDRRRRICKPGDHIVGRQVQQRVVRENRRAAS